MLFVFLLVACAHSPNWQKDGATQVQSRQDAKLCEYESLKIVEKENPHIRSTHGQEMDKSARRRVLTIACMRSKGYEEAQKNASLPRLPVP